MPAWPWSAPPHPHTARQGRCLCTRRVRGGGLCGALARSRDGCVLPPPLHRSPTRIQPGCLAMPFYPPPTPHTTPSTLPLATTRGAHKAWRRRRRRRKRGGLVRLRSLSSHRPHPPTHPPTPSHPTDGGRHGHRHRGGGLGDQQGKRDAPPTRPQRGQAQQGPGRKVREWVDKWMGGWVECATLASASNHASPSSLTHPPTHPPTHHTGPRECESARRTWRQCGKGLRHASVRRTRST